MFDQQKLMEANERLQKMIDAENAARGQRLKDLEATLRAAKQASQALLETDRNEIKLRQEREQERREGERELLEHDRHLRTETAVRNATVLQSPLTVNHPLRLKTPG